MQPQQYPAYPPTAAQPGYPAQPVNPYPAAQYPQAPAPAPYPVPPAGYPVPVAYPPAGYAPAPGYPMAPPVQPSAPGSLDSFYGQPSTSGGPSWKFQGKPFGTTYVGVVERPVVDSDVRQATNNQNVPQFYRDGRPKFIMVVPMLVPVSAEFPEGKAGWWVKGQARDELVRAMTEAGCPAGMSPEAGAVIQITYTGQRSIPNMNPAHQFAIVYTRPTGAAPQAIVAQIAAHYGAPQYAPQPQYAPMGSAGYAPPQQPQQYAAAPAQPQQYVPQAPPASVPPAYAPQGAPQPQYAQAPAPPGYGPPPQPPVTQAPPPQPQFVPQPAPQQQQYAPVPAAVGPPPLNAEQQALMAQLTGGQPA